MYIKPYLKPPDFFQSGCSLFPPAMDESSDYSASKLVLDDIVGIFYFNNSNRRMVESHSNVNLHFPNGKRWVF